jgi:NADH-quinone oxidoreductase subunit E
VCRGTACHVKGSAAVLKAMQRLLNIEPGQTSRDGLFSLEVVACIGACGLAPVVSINGEFHGNLTADDIPKILNQYRKKEKANG